MSQVNAKPKTLSASKSKTKPYSAEQSKDDVAQLMTNDVTEILHQDHMKVQNMFFQFRFLEDAKEKKQLVDEILKELYMHTVVEEEIVYPEAAEDADEPDVQCIVDEAYTEHHVAKVLMAELAGMKPTDERFDAKVTVLYELIRHHIHEEEKEMFKKLKESGIDLEELAEEVMRRKEELQGESVATEIKEIWKELKEFKTA